MHSNHTETSTKVLRQRAAYVAAHREYFAYLHHLLDTATLPASDVPLPNMTTMAAMVAEMRAMHPRAAWLSGVVLGRLLHRVFSPMLTWHGGRHSVCRQYSRMTFSVETTIYRFCEVPRGRKAFKFYASKEQGWTNNYDQWQDRGNTEVSEK